MSDPTCEHEYIDTMTELASIPPCKPRNVYKCRKCGYIRHIRQANSPPPPVYTSADLDKKVENIRVRNIEVEQLYKKQQHTSEPLLR